MHSYCNLFVAAVSSLVKKSHSLFNMAAVGEYSVQCSFCFVFRFCLFAFFFIIILHIKGKKAIFVFSVLF